MFDRGGLFLNPVRLAALGIILLVLSGCGGGGTGGSSSGAPQPDASLIKVSPPDSQGRIAISGSPHAVAGKGSVVARNLSESAKRRSFITGVAEAAVTCPSFRSTTASAPDGSFAGLKLCAASGDH